MSAFREGMPHGAYRGPHGRMDGSNQKLRLKITEEPQNFDFGISAEYSSSILTGENTCFFQIKSSSLENVETSIRYGVWATISVNETILGNAFEVSSFVVLIFSVSLSSCFSGYAVMKSRPGMSSIKQNVFFRDGKPFRGRMFDVQWIRCFNLEFQACKHLHNPLNQNKPVRTARDGQEIERSIGVELCSMIDKGWSELVAITTMRGALLHEPSAMPAMPPAPLPLGYGYGAPVRYPPVPNARMKAYAEPQEVAMPHIDYEASIAAMNIYPIDLTHMRDYEEYKRVYHASQGGAPI